MVCICICIESFDIYFNETNKMVFNFNIFSVTVLQYSYLERVSEINIEHGFLYEFTTTTIVITSYGCCIHHLYVNINLITVNLMWIVLKRIQSLIIVN